MSKFESRRLEQIKAKELVEQLYINGVGQLAHFYASLEGTTYIKEFYPLLAFIEHFANGGEPGRKVKYLKGNTGPTELEFISKHLRIYAIQLPGKKIILYGGVKKKSDSSDNIAAFRAIKRAYLNYLNKQK